jgi:hypothetical protein
MAQASLEHEIYSSSPLDSAEPSIRLLKACSNVLPGEDLAYDLETFTLAQCPEYKALSYTWGNPFPTDRVRDPFGRLFPPDEEFEKRTRDWETAHYPIECNECLLFVHLNLFEALYQLSVLGERGYLWVDRICIDQSNTLERSTQVALMSKIYSKAAKVIVWLGREGKDSSGALEIQNNFGGSLFDLWEEGDLTRKDVQAHNPEDPCYLNIFRLQKMSVKVLFSWTQFYRRSWFFRRWTLQETALARQIDILCGNQIFDWQKLNFLDWYFGTSG